MITITGLEDINHNNHWDGDDLAAGFKKLGILPGSPEAKQIWQKIDQDAHSPEAKLAAQKINPKAVGMFEGHPLVPGQAAPGQGDYQLLVQKLHYSEGMDWPQAKQVADQALKKVLASQQAAAKPAFTPGVKAAVATPVAPTAK